MNSEEAYGTWAPGECPWSPWVKPILFSVAWSSYETSVPAPEEPMEPAWVSGVEPSTAFVVDLPGAESLRLGVALARKGWRPVPLYNALPGETVAPLAPDSALVDVSAIVRGLRPATELLQHLALAADRPPAFLLDAQRRFGSGVVPQPGKFDNRSVSLPTDFPSALFLRSHGIRQVVLVQPTDTQPQADLAHTLLAWQQAGLPILAKGLDAEGAPRPIQVSRPSNFRGLLYRFLATLGLRRSPLGGFGGRIPEPSAG